MFSDPESDAMVSAVWPAECYLKPAVAVFFCLDYLVRSIRAFTRFRHSPYSLMYVSI